MEQQPNAAPVGISLDDLHTVDEFAAKHPNILTKATLQWQLRFRDKNGLEKACIKLGRKLLIHGPSYELWLAAGGPGRSPTRLTPAATERRASFVQGGRQ